MNFRLSNRGSSFVLAAFQILVGALGIGLASQAAADAVDPRYGAFVEVYNLEPHLFEGQNAVSGSVAASDGDGDGDAALTEGGASFAGMPTLWVNVVSDSDSSSGVTGHAYVRDTFTFSVAGGGSALVPVRLSGTWGGLGGYVVALLGLGMGDGLPVEFHSALGWASELPSEPGFKRSGNASTGYFGTYTIDALWNVADGGVYSFLAGVYAQSWDGGYVYINDPITISLPDGVSFTSASNSGYAGAVPEPSAWLLLCGGIAVLAWRHRRPPPPAVARPGHTTAA